MKKGQIPQNKRPYFNDAVGLNDWKEMFNKDSKRNKEARNVARKSKRKKK